MRTCGTSALRHVPHRLPLHRRYTRRVIHRSAYCYLFLNSSAGSAEEGWTSGGAPRCPSAPDQIDVPPSAGPAGLDGPPEPARPTTPSLGRTRTSIRGRRDAARLRASPVTQEGRSGTRRGPTQPSFSDAHGETSDARGDTSHQSNSELGRSEPCVRSLRSGHRRAKKRRRWKTARSSVRECAKIGQIWARMLCGFRNSPGAKSSSRPLELAKFDRIVVNEIGADP